MKLLLAGINAKFIQSNLAVRLLRAYAAEHSVAVRAGSVRVEIAEWNVNMHVQSIVRGIYEKKADAVFFSTYIWNRESVFRVADTLRVIAPGLVIAAGGPEVSYDPARAFSDCDSLDFIILGEGEETFSEIADLTGNHAGIISKDNGSIPSFRETLCGKLRGVRGLSIPERTGAFYSTEARPLIGNLSEIPFPYGYSDDDLDPANRIVYYESGRGCPYSCAYCLSSVERSVRFYPLERVYADLDFFLERRWPIVKFVDRTFNIDPERYRAIWRHISERHNGRTLFHFEIAADLLGPEDFALLDRMPEGAVQFEIGVQSANAETLRAVNRKTDLEKIAAALKRIPKTVHTHVDLIAGLPLEDFPSFARSFDYAFSLGSDVVQLGFLKILSGTPMERLALSDPGFRWSPEPPYEVLRSPFLSFDDLLLLKDVEHVVDNLWNTGVFRKFLGYLAARSDSAFDFFRDLSRYIRSWFPDGDLFLPRRHMDLFACLAAFNAQTGVPEALELLKFDFFLQAKPGKIPSWLNRRYSKEAHDAALESSGFLAEVAGVRRAAYARSEYEEFLLPGEDTRVGILFMYNSPEEKSRGTRFKKMPYNGA